MNFRQFQDQLDSAGDVGLAIQLPSGQRLPPHFHITEVGNVQKRFIDCGGTFRQESTCVLQTLVAGDIDHRLKTGKLSQILTASSALSIAGNVPVELEIQGSTIELYSVANCERENDFLLIQLQAKSTACLAEDKCGIGSALPQIGDGCCGSTGCC